MYLLILFKTNNNKKNITSLLVEENYLYLFLSQNSFPVAERRQLRSAGG